MNTDILLNDLFYRRIGTGTIKPTENLLLALKILFLAIVKGPTPTGILYSSLRIWNLALRKNRKLVDIYAYHLEPLFG